MAQLTALAIAPQVEDNFSAAVAEFQKEVEQQASTIAPDPSFNYIHDAHQEFAQDTSREFNRVRLECILHELNQGERILESKARLTRRKEFSQWKQSLSATTSDIRKWVKLVLTFGGFPIEKIIAIAASTNIYSLCTPKFEELVEKFRELPVLASDRIKQMVKEARPLKKPKQPKQQMESPVEWHRDESGGGRHLSINLYDDELGVKIKHDAEEQQITPQQVIKQAFRKSELVEEVQREHTEAVNEVRQMHIQMQREIHSSRQVIQQQREQIEELQAAQASVQPFFKSGEGKKPAIYIEHFTAWEQLAEAVNYQSDRLLAVARLASEQERSHFAQLLAEFCEENQKAFDHIDWVPPRLLNSALAQLSFSISRLADTHIADDLVVEIIHGCKFVSVKNLGVPGERWVFQFPDRKNIPVSDRSQIEIERF